MHKGWQGELSEEYQLNKWLRNQSLTDTVNVWQIRSSSWMNEWIKSIFVWKLCISSFTLLVGNLIPSFALLRCYLSIPIIYSFLLLIYIILIWCDIVFHENFNSLKEETWLPFFLFYQSLFWHIVAHHQNLYISIVTCKSNELKWASSEYLSYTVNIVSDLSNIWVKVVRSEVTRWLNGIKGPGLVWLLLSHHVASPRSLRSAWVSGVTSSV